MRRKAWPGVDSWHVHRPLSVDLAPDPGDKRALPGDEVWSHAVLLSCPSVLPGTAVLAFWRPPDPLRSALDPGTFAVNRAGVLAAPPGTAVLSFRRPLDPWHARDGSHGEDNVWVARSSNAPRLSSFGLPGTEVLTFQCPPDL